MKRVLALAVSAPLLLIGATLPYSGVDQMASAAPSTAERSPSGRYAACRPGPGDDHCIQLYERGVRAAYARWVRERSPTEQATRVAMGGPEEPTARRQASARNCVPAAAQEAEARGM